MQIYYFDTKDGLPSRDFKGTVFAKTVEAIEHSKKLAASIRGEAQKHDRDLIIVVTDDSGREVHRERVYEAE